MTTELTTTRERSQYARVSEMVDTLIDRMDLPPLLSHQHRELHGRLFDELHGRLFDLLYYRDRDWAQTSAALLERAS